MPSQQQTKGRAHLCNVLRTMALKRVREAYCSIICCTRHTGNDRPSQHTAAKTAMTTNALTGETRISRRRACNVPSYSGALPYHDWPRPPPLDLTREIILVGSPLTLAFYDYHSELNLWLRAQMVATHDTPSGVEEVASADPLVVQSDTSYEEPDPFGFGGGLD